MKTLHFFKETYRRLARWIRKGIRAITPGKNAVKGAGYGLMAVAGILWLIFSIRLYINLRDPWILLLCLAFLLIFVLGGFLVRWALGKLNEIPRFLLLALLITIPAYFFVTSFEAILVVFAVLVSALLGAGLWVLRRTGFMKLSKPKRVISILGIVLGLGGFIAAGILYARKGFEMDPMINAALAAPNQPEILDLPSPAEKGPYTVKTLTYGSGEDRHRPEYGVEVDLKTQPVNGLAFIDDWDGFGGWWREKYWGFNSKSLPINARVWYPEGEGPFPLALIVHGNHGMQDYSDPGYEYLGELLASKGIILASVDENFINGSWSNIFGGLDTENDARGWLLLEHLRVWHEWNETRGHEFEGKIDTENLALIGHSRGGEAVGHAAMFNALPYYPDDASQKFDYNYSIKSIVAIAPVDGQYEPGKTLTKFENVSYFVIHGAQDADVSSFMGSQQFERIQFTDSLYHFKAGVYVYGANHGQFNTSWGDNDLSSMFTGQLNLGQLLSAEDQERIAEVYIGSFLDITLKDRKEYLPLFMDARKGRDWLPETIYLSQFEDSSLEPIADFDEDFDLSTIKRDKGFAGGENLTVWREGEIQLKWRKKGSRALFLGWHYESEENDGKEDEGEKSGDGAEDWEKEEPSEESEASKKIVLAAESVPDSLLASYTIGLDSLAIEATDALVFSMAESTEASNPKSKGKWVNNEEDNGEEDDDEGDAVDDGPEDDKEEEKEDEEEKAKEPLDFTIRLTDSEGQSISFPLSEFSPLQREIEVLIMKTGRLGDDVESEKVFQTFYFPVADIIEANPELDLSHLVEISFHFDRSKSGVVVIDRIGFMKAF